MFAVFMWLKLTQTFNIPLLKYCREFKQPIIPRTKNIKSDNYLLKIELCFLRYVTVEFTYQFSSFFSKGKKEITNSAFLCNFEVMSFDCRLENRLKSFWSLKFNFNTWEIVIVMSFYNRMIY